MKNRQKKDIDKEIRKKKKLTILKIPDNQLREPECNLEVGLIDRGKD